MRKVLAWSVLIICVLTQAGCSYLFSREVRGGYLDAPRLLVGYIDFYHSDHGQGSLTVGRPEKAECRGEFAEEPPGQSVIGSLVKTKRFYSGRLFCLEGSKGSFLFSTVDGTSGKIIGAIASKPFELEIQPDHDRFRSSKYNSSWEGTGEEWRSTRLAEKAL